MTQNVTFGAPVANQPHQIKLHLHEAQMKVFTDTTRFRVVAAGRRFGKTRLAISEAVCAALDPRNDQKKPVFIVAPVATQAKTLYWQPLIDAFGPLVKGVNVNEGMIHLQNGVLVRVTGSDRPETLLGVGLYFVVIDEYADIKPMVWDTILRPTLSDVRGRAMFIGSPRGRNHFYDQFRRGGGDGATAEPDWKSFHFTTLDNPFIPKDEIEAARRDMSSATFRREYLASFEVGGTDIFKEEWIKIADEPPKRAAKAMNSKLEEIPGQYFVAVDLAGFADVAVAEGYRQKRLDQTAIAVVKIDDDKNWWVKDIHLGRWGVDETARRIVDAVEKSKATALGIEKGALYNAVEPKIRTEAAKRRLTVRAQPLSHENKSKADRIVWALQGPMEHGRIIFRRADWNRDIKDQLLNFPSSLVHDDGIEALAYVDQLAQHHLFNAFADAPDEPYWEPTDSVIGY